jgi:hypothetical protein
LTLDSVLNLIWAAIAVVALALLARSERSRMGSRWMRVRRAAAVTLMALALFPCVSVSDDLFSFSFLRTQLGGHGGYGSPVPESSKDTSGNLQLFRLLQTLDHFQISAVCALAVSFFCLGLTLRYHRPTVRGTAILLTGRAPPVF